MSYYSERNEQDWVMGRFGAQPRGVFIDIGALDGVRYSNTRALVDMGWCGVCVEPNPESFAALVRNCAGLPVTCVRAAVHPPPPVGAEALLLLDSAEPARCSMQPDMTKQFVSWTGAVEPVRTLTPAELLDRVTPPPCFDFLAVDAEGDDEWILRCWLYSVARPGAIMAETMHDPHMASRLDALLGTHGYRHDWSNGFNTAWVSKL